MSIRRGLPAPPLYASEDRHAIHIGIDIAKDKLDVAPSADCFLGSYPISKGGLRKLTALAEKAECLLNVSGVGPVTAAVMLARVPEHGVGP